MKFPLKVNPAPAANPTAGEPAWLVSDASGWPVCLCWKQEYAERIVEAMNAVASQSAAETGLVGLVTTDSRTPDEADISLATGAAPQPGDPWLTTSRADWPAELWPPRPGDRITVTTPRVIAASRPT